MASIYTTPPLTPEEEDQNQLVDDGSTMEPIQEEIPEERELNNGESSSNEGRTIINSYDNNVNVEFCNSITDNSVPFTGPDNYHKLATQQKKETVHTLTALKVLSDTLKKLLNSPHFHDEWNPEKKALNEQYNKVNECLQIEQKKLTDISTLSNKFKQNLSQPRFGSNDKLNIEEARLAVPLFSDDSDSSNLMEFWQKLVVYVETEKYSENATKSLLSFLLQGRPYRTFYSNKDKSLEEICAILIDRHGNVTTISDKIKALDSISRNERLKISTLDLDASGHLALQFDKHTAW